MPASRNHFSFCHQAWIMVNLDVRFFETCGSKNGTHDFTQFALAVAESEKQATRLEEFCNKLDATPFCEKFGRAKIKEIRRNISRKIRNLNIKDPKKIKEVNANIRKLAIKLLLSNAGSDELQCNGCSKKEDKDGFADIFIKTLQEKAFVYAQKKGQWCVYVPLRQPCPIRYDPSRPKSYKNVGNVCRKLLEDTEKSSLRQSTFITKYLCEFCF